MLFPSLLIAYAACVACIACNGAPPTAADTPQADGGTTLQFQPDTVTLTVGEHYAAGATLLSRNGLDASASKPVQWRAADATVALVSPDGEVTAVGPGSTTVECAASGAKLTLGVSVRPAAAPGPLASVTPSSADSLVSSIGVNTHLSYFDRVYGMHFDDIVLPKLVRLGARHVRDGGQVSADSDRMRKAYGRYRELAAATGAKFTIIMSPSGAPTGVAPDYGSAQHVFTLVSRIGAENIEAFEGLNEHDLSGRPAWAREVRQMQAALYALVKSDPALAARVVVVGPSLGRLSSVDALGDLSGMVDVGNMHPYPGGGIPTNGLNLNISKYKLVARSKPLVATESGYHTAVGATTGQPGVSEAAMTKYVPRLFLEYFKAGVVRTFEYELIDQGTSPAEAEHSFGLLRNDGSEKPAYTALRRLIALLQDAGPAFQPGAVQMALSGDTTNVHAVVLGKRNGRIYVALWQEVPSYDLRQRSDLTVVPRKVELLLAQPRVVHVYVPGAADSALARIAGATRISLAVADQVVIAELLPP